MSSRRRYSTYFVARLQVDDNFIKKRIFLLFCRPGENRKKITRAFHRKQTYFFFGLSLIFFILNGCYSQADLSILIQMPPALNQGFTRTLFHMYVQCTNESKYHIHCVIKYCWKYRKKYRRTLENYLNSPIIRMSPCHTDQ